VPSRQAASSSYLCRPTHNPGESTFSEPRARDLDRRARRLMSNGWTTPTACRLRRGAADRAALPAAEERRALHQHVLQLRAGAARSVGLWLACGTRKMVSPRVTDPCPSMCPSAIATYFDTMLARADQDDSGRLPGAPEALLASTADMIARGTRWDPARAGSRLADPHEGLHSEGDRCQGIEAGCYVPYRVLRRKAPADRNAHVST